jgi:hypothetical protein
MHGSGCDGCKIKVFGQRGLSKRIMRLFAQEESLFAATLVCETV